MIRDETRQAIFDEVRGVEPSYQPTLTERAEYHVEKAGELVHSSKPEHVQQSIAHSQLALAQLQLSRSQWMLGELPQ